MPLDIAKHKSIFIKILKSVFTDSTIGPFLGFKGGTAAYLFYNLNRFSVDLDFDLLDAAKEDYIFERVKKILENYGTLKTALKKRYNLFYLLSYDKKKEGVQNIKVEINRRDFGSKYNVKSYLGISMKVMTRDDMAANKLVAMYERIGKTSRDIFDVWFFLENDWPINHEIIKSRTGLSFKEFLEKCIMALGKIDNRDILAGMGELLSQSQKDWAKTKLIPDTIFLLKLKLDEEK